MASVRDITAADIADTDHVTVNVGQTLSKVRTVMEDEDLRTIPVVDGKRFAGMLSYRDVMEKLRSDPSKTKIDGLLHTPPVVEEDDNLVELASFRINAGRRKFPLLDDHDRLEGVVGERQVAYAAADTEELRNEALDTILQRDLITVDADRSHDTARRLMMDNNVSRLPVLDDDRFTGVIASRDVLRAMVPREQMDGGRGGHYTGRGQSASGDAKGEKGSMSDIPVRELMQPRDSYEKVLLEDAGMSLSDAVGRMEQAGRKEVLLLEGDAPAGIATTKDVLARVSELRPTEMLHVQLTGPEVPEEKQVIHDKVETAIRGGLGRVLYRPEELTIHMKKYEQDGTRHKYSLHFKLMSKEGVTTVKTHGWELLDAVDEGLEKLETVLKRKKEKRIDQKRERQRKGKYAGS